LSWAWSRAREPCTCASEAATARIDLGQQLTGLDLVTFLEVQLDQLARDLGAHHGRGVHSWCRWR
jgi:hypothetical protein